MTETTAFMALTDLVASFETKRLSPLDAVRTAYRRIDRHEGDLNAFCYLLDEDEALAAAREAERRWAQGAPAGPLDGVPITVKDAILATGWATLRGSQLSDPGTPDAEDSPSVARVREAGAIVIGKTTMPEFGWKGVTDCPLSGITRSPWNLAMTPGGSSGGSAAALAAGIGNAAIGTDAGGSVRIPGSFSGLVALKASYGRVANYPLSAAGTLSHIGPMTRTVADTALMLNVLARPDARDPANLPYDGRDFRAGIEDSVQGLRVAFSPTLGYGRVDPEVAGPVAKAAGALEELGADVEQIDVPFENPSECFRIHFFSGISHALKNLTPEQRGLIDPGILPILEQAREIGRAEYMEAIDWRVAFSRAAKRFLDTFDVLVTPTMAVPPFEAGRLSPDGYDQENWIEWSPFTYPFNLTGQPAISVPCGFTEAGLPVGMQIVGQYHDEATVLRAARAYEAAHPTTDRRPPLS